MQIDTEELQEKLKALDSYSAEDQHKLQRLLSEPWFRRVLKELMVEADERRRTFTNMDMTTEDSVKQAIRAQGQIQGLDRAFDLIVELAQTQEEDEG
jgi:hypothetical protein